MANQTIFKRYEYKYLLTADQKKDLQAYMETYMKPDTFGRNTICNLYFDTPDYLLIRRSIEGKVYKEKIRLRYRVEKEIKRWNLYDRFLR